MNTRRPLSFFLSLCLIISMITAPVPAAAASDTGLKYQVSVSIDPGQMTGSAFNSTTFANDLKTAMVALSPSSLTASQIQVNFVESSTVTTQNESIWKIYDYYYSPTYAAIGSPTDSDKAALLELAGRTGQPFYYYRESSPFGSTYYTSPDQGLDYVHYRDKHIYAAGQRIKFLGYSSPAYNDFMIYPDQNSGDKTIKYSVYTDGVSTHTLDGAGFLVNASISEGKINGYLIYSKYTQGNRINNRYVIAGETIYLYKLTNVDVTSLHTQSSSIANITGVSSVTSTNPAVNSKDKAVKDIKIQIVNNVLNYYEQDGTISNGGYTLVFSQALVAGTGNGYGPYVDYLSHGCPELTVFTYDNLEMSTSDTKTFSENVLQPTWQDGAVHAMVNVDFRGISGLNNGKTKSELLNRMVDNNVHYIGWGTSGAIKTEALAFIKENNNMGIYLDESGSEVSYVSSLGAVTTASASDYQAQVQKIAAYLVGLRVPDPATDPVADIEFSGGVLTSASVATSGASISDTTWKFKEASDPYWQSTSDAAVATTSIQAILASTGAVNVILQLQVTDNQGNPSEPDSIVLSNTVNAAPIAQFNLSPGSINLEASGGSKILYTINNSFDTYATPRALTYQWQVYDEMNSLVTNSSATEPTFDFSGSAAGTYYVKLTVSTGGIVSNTYTRTVALTDAVAPSLSVNVSGSSSSATAIFTITDNGSGPGSYRINTTTANSSINGPWIAAQGNTFSSTVTKSYSFNPSQITSLTIEVKDGTGNTANYPVDFSKPVIAYNPDGGNFYTNFDYSGNGNKIQVILSSLQSGVAVRDGYYQWSDSATAPANIQSTGLPLATTTTSISIPTTAGTYYLHTYASTSSSGIMTDAAVSNPFQVSASSNTITDFAIATKSATSYVFTWTPPAGATGQKIMISSDGGVTWRQASTTPSLTPSSNSATVSGLSSTVEYSFRLYVNGSAAVAGASEIIGKQPSNTDTNTSRRSGRTVTPIGTPAFAQVNGNTQQVGTTKSETSGGETQETVTINPATVTNLIQDLPRGASFHIPFSGGNADSSKVQLTLGTVEQLFDKDISLSVNTGTVGYTIPRDALNITGLAAQFGTTPKSEIEFSIKIADVSENVMGLVQDLAKQDGFQLVIPPVEFQVSASFNGKTVEVDQFSGYVARDIEIPAGVDPSRITTAIVVKEDGSSYHVPTNVHYMDNKWYARINSLTNSVYTLIYNEAKLTDIDGRWFEKPVSEAASRMILMGYKDGTFRGGNPITRAEFAVMLINTVGLDKIGDSNFTDVQKQNWFYGVVSRAYELNLITGRTGNNFDPRANISRQEAMIMLKRTAELCGMDAPKSVDLKGYSDYDSLSVWARDAASFSVGNELIKGSNNALRPRDNITRAEASVSILRLLQKTELIDTRTKL